MQRATRLVYSELKPDFEAQTTKVTHDDSNRRVSYFEQRMRTRPHARLLLNYQIHAVCVRLCSASMAERARVL